jgi:hypothetical protein
MFRAHPFWFSPSASVAGFLIFFLIVWLMIAWIF